MRPRTTLALLAVLALAGPPPAHAGPPKQIIDPRDDWDVPSQDIVMARVYGVLVAKKPQLRTEMQLVEAPAAGVPSIYKFRFTVGCVTYYFVHEWTGTAAAGTSGTFEKWDYCKTPRSDERQTVTFTLTGTTLTWTTPYLYGVRRGMKAIALHAEACPGTCADSGDGPVIGDEGFSRKPYVVGNDLPRK